MTQKGISKMAARRLLEEAGLFIGVSYAKRAAPNDKQGHTHLGKHWYQPPHQEGAQPQKLVEQQQEKAKTKQQQDGN